MTRLPKVHTPRTGRYIRIRVREPKRFIKASFRTHDIGRPGHTLRVAGRLKKNKKWATQAFLILKSEKHLVPKFKSQAKSLIRRAKR